MRMPIGSVRLLHEQPRRRRPSEQDMVDVRIRARAWRWNRVLSIAEGSEQVSGIGSGRRRLPDAHVVSETGRAHITAGRDVSHEIAPESDHVVLVVAAA